MLRPRPLRPASRRLRAAFALLLALAAPVAAQPVLTYATINTVSGDNVQSGGVARDAAGNTYVGGDFQGTVDLDPSDGPDASDTFSSGGTNNAAYLASYGGAGALRWVVFVPAPNPTAVNVRAVAVDETQAYFAGFFDGTPDFDPGPGTATPGAGTRQFVAAYDRATGAFRWVNFLPNTTVITALAARAGRVTLAGGFSDATADFDPGAGTFNLTVVGAAAWVGSYAAATGAFQWAGALDGSGFDRVDFYGSGSARESPALAADAERVYVAGYFEGTADLDPGAGTQSRTSAGSNDAYLVALDAATGAFGWGHALGGTSTEGAIALTVDGANVYATGYNGTTDFDPGAGTATRAAGTFLAAYDRATGAYRWADAFNASLDWNRLAADGARVYGAGVFRGTQDFDPGTAVQNRTAFNFNATTTSTDVALAAYAAADGAYVWGNAVGTTQNETAVGVAVSGGRVVVTGRFGGSSTTADFDAGPGTENRTSFAPQVYVATYDAATGALATTVGVEELPSAVRLFRAAPNPSGAGQGRVRLVLDAPRRVTLVLYDVLGRRAAVLFAGEAAAGAPVEAALPAGLPAGVYVVRAEGAGFAASLRVTVLR